MSKENINVIDEKAKFDLDFEKYKILITARNFHYDNFNKWMTYFYVAIGALFVGYTTVYSSDSKIDNTFLLNIICFLGFISSILWLLSSKGYYYWNINFITLVNHYEEKILRFPENERIYFVFANKNTENYYYLPHRGANISTSKVAIFFAYLISCFWGVLLFKDFFKLSNNMFLNLIIWILLSILVITISLFCGKSFFKSKINHFHDLKINQD